MSETSLKGSTHSGGGREVVVVVKIHLRFELKDDAGQNFEGVWDGPPFLYRSRGGG